MKREIKGRKPGEACAACKTGRLVIVMGSRTGRSTGGVIGSFSYQVIDVLACSDCGQMYAVDKDLRGKTVTQVLEAQVDGLVNRGRQPKHCRACRGELEEGRRPHYRPFGLSGLASPPIGVDTYLFCDTCLSVAWVLERYKPPSVDLSKSVMRRLAVQTQAPDTKEAKKSE